MRVSPFPSTNLQDKRPCFQATCTTERGEAAYLSHGAIVVVIEDVEE